MQTVREGDVVVVTEVWGNRKGREGCACAKRCMNF
jgi:hypothetical protein